MHTCTHANSLSVVYSNLSRTVQDGAVLKIKEKRNPSHSQCADLQMFPFCCRYKAASLVGEKANRCDRGRAKEGVKPSNLHFKGEKQGDNIRHSQILDVYIISSHSTGRKVEMTFYHNGESLIPQVP